MADAKPRRNTRQRDVILDELRKVETHPTAAELHDLVRGRLEKISLGTVYRNLELLGEMGVVRKLQLSGAETRFDGNVQQHDHVRCLRCNRVDDVYGAPLDLSRAKENDFMGYRILGHRLEFTGICPRCLAEESHPEPDDNEP